MECPNPRKLSKSHPQIQNKNPKMHTTLSTNDPLGALKLDNKKLITYVQKQNTKIE